MFRTGYTLLIILFVSTSLYSQNTDSLFNNASSDTTKKENNSIPEFAEMTKSPTGALWRTFIVPGWGQFYNEDYWKAPIFTATWGILGYMIYDNHNQFMDIKKLTDEMDQSDPEYSALRNEREHYRDNRDLFAMYLLGVYGIAAIDAYTGAHLFDFNVDDDLAVKFRPSPMGLSVWIEF